MRPKPIRAFARGLEVLAALNRAGSATALGLARETGVPRASVYRLLETLLAEGYVARSPSDDRFTPAPRLRSLSEGVEEEGWIGAIAAPALFRLTERIGWPCDLCTLEGTAMRIRETTHRAARFSIDRGMAGRSLPVLESSVGLAWLAFAPDQARETLLALIAPQGPPSALRGELARTRARGHALRPGGQGPWPHTGSIALPVRDGATLLGCVNAIWMARAVSDAEGVRLCLGPLRDTVAEIEARIRAAAPPAG